MDNLATRTLRFRLALLGLLLLSLAFVPLALLGEEQEQNLLKNPGFEMLDDKGLPLDWTQEAYWQVAGVTDFSVTDGQEGKGVRIENNDLNDARFVQQVKVLPNTHYRLSGSVRVKAEEGWGANLSVGGAFASSEPLFDTNGAWQEISLVGRTGPEQKKLNVFVRLGGYGGEALGWAVFDNISLVRLDEAPSGVTVQSFAPAPDKQESAGETDLDQPASPFWPWLLVLAVVYALMHQVLQPRMPAISAASDTWFDRWGGLAAVLLAGLVLRLWLAVTVPGYGVDMGCFSAWADMMCQHGPGSFYLQQVHSDYPPGYMLMLWPVGLVLQGVGEPVRGLVLKLWPILFDLLTVVLLYRVAQKALGRRAALFVSALYAFHPLVLVTGAAWGQVDSILTFFILLALLFVMKERWLWAIPTFVVAALIKPQALMFGPVGLAALILQVKNAGDRRRLLLKDALYGLGIAAGVAALIVLPFAVKRQGLGWLFDLYFKTMGFYDQATVNTTNLYFLFGGNWQKTSDLAPWAVKLVGSLTLALPLVWGLYAPQGEKSSASKRSIALSAGLVATTLLLVLLPMTLKVFGFIMMGVSFALTLAMLWRSRNTRHLPFYAALNLILYVTLGVMMHERYIYPAIALLFVAFVLSKDRRIAYLLLALGISSFLNVGIVLDRAMRIPGVEGHLSAPLFGIVSESAWLESLLSGFSVLIAAMALYLGVLISGKDDKPLALASVHRDRPEDQEDRGQRLLALRRERQALGLVKTGKKDLILMLVVCLIYGALALWNLGDTKAPQTFYDFTKTGEEASFDLGSVKRFQLMQYGGIQQRDNDYVVLVSEDGDNWTESYAQLRGGDSGDCFAWRYQKPHVMQDGQRKFDGLPLVHEGRFIKIRAERVGTSLFEIAAQDPDSKATLPITALSDNARALVDEQALVPESPSYLNSMYFDETYHARTAYEQLNAIRGLDPSVIYETSHPPLGKFLMTISLAIFGMNPFAWRLPGALAGVLMLPALYMMAHLLTRRRGLALAAMLLFSVDIMHYAQTRIATIDSFVTLFILWAYYLLFRFVLSDNAIKEKWQGIGLLWASGAMLGLAVASKWTGVYAGIGMAVIYLWDLARRLREQFLAMRIGTDDAGVPGNNPLSIVLFSFLFGLVFFVIQPLLIYVLSFWPVTRSMPGGLTIQNVIDLSRSMLDYHAMPGLGMNHYFYSPWYQWPLSLKPMWYYASPVTAGKGSTILTFGNLAVWWSGLIGFLCLAAVFIRQHLMLKPVRLSWQNQRDDRAPALVLIAALAQYLPWVLVPRGTYIYHYFPTVPFIILATVVVLSMLSRRSERTAAVITWSLVILSVLFFIAFFPYASGLPVSIEWLNAMRWFPNWLYY